MAMNETNFVDVNVQDATFVEVENLVDDTQLSAEAVCACGDPDGMGFCLNCWSPAPAK